LKSSVMAAEAWASARRSGTVSIAMTRSAPKRNALLMANKDLQETGYVR
jgi:hypothetical protein